MITRVSSPVLARNKDLSTEKESPEEGVIRWLNERIGKVIQAAVKQLGQTEKIEEIRLRVNQPLIIRTERKEYFITASGLLGSKETAYSVTKADLIEILDRMTHSSIYAAEEELRQGFFTLSGGHRVGISGETVVENGMIRTIKNISALNFRLARQPGSKAVHLLPLLLDRNKNLCHTLLVSPPRGGKTTVLRLLVKSLSDGVPELGLEGQSVGVVDERSEIAGMWQGTPAFDLGCRTDVLDRCPKVQGLNMLIRSMSPSIVAVDELGGPDEVFALNDAVRCGVKILATAHAGSLEELRRRPFLQDLFEKQVFERAVILSRDRGPGTIEGVYDLVTGNTLSSGLNRRV
ncbi:MAG: stage III sporulation protein AA [Peptococcaceae bacterium]|nr:stage III sporulation protein AA [Peptococcaceae bacterium]